MTSFTNSFMKYQNMSAPPPLQIGLQHWLTGQVFHRFMFLWVSLSFIEVSYDRYRYSRTTICQYIVTFVQCFPFVGSPIIFEPGNKSLGLFNVHRFSRLHNYLPRQLLQLLRNGFLKGAGLVLCLEKIFD